MLCLQDSASGQPQGQHDKLSQSHVRCSWTRCHTKPKHTKTHQNTCRHHLHLSLLQVVGGWWLVVGGWWLVVGGWWLVVGGWWLVVGGWWLVALTFVVLLMNRQSRGDTVRFRQ